MRQAFRGAFFNCCAAPRATPGSKRLKGSDMIVAEALAQALQRHGVELIFSQCFPVRTQHVLPKYGIRQIGFRTENAGGAMADGYARISRHIAVVAAQSGPGATLLVPPLAECLCASIPV